MNELDQSKKIESLLNGFTAPTAPSTPRPRPRGFGAPSPPPPPPRARQAIAPPTVAHTNVRVPFFDQTRRYRPDAEEVFKMEQQAAKEYAEEIAPEGYEVSDPTFHRGFSPMTTPLKQIAKSKHHAARIQFVDWLKNDQPDVYAALVEKLETGEVGATQAQTTATATTPLWQRIVSGLSTLTATVAGAQAQKRILDLNIQRAGQGLPPVDAASMAPVVRTEVSVTPEMAADLQAGAQKALIIGGAIAAGLLVLSMLRKKR